MKFDRSNKFEFCYYGQVNTFGGNIYSAGDGTYPLLFVQRELVPFFGNISKQNVDKFSFGAIAEISFSVASSRSRKRSTATVRARCAVQ